MSKFSYHEDNSDYCNGKLSELYRKVTGISPLEKARARQLLNWREKLYKLSRAII